MRVAVRRLRSGLSALKPMLPLEDRCWASEELKWLTHALGPARNWDAFAASLLGPVRDALSASRELEYLVKAVEGRRHAAFDDAKKRSFLNDTPNLTLRLLRWFEARRWREQPLSEQAAFLWAPLANIAPELIERCYR